MGMVLQGKRNRYYTTIGRDATSPLSSKCLECTPSLVPKVLSLSISLSATLKKSSSRNLAADLVRMHAPIKLIVLLAFYMLVWKEAAADERGPALGHMRKAVFCRPLKFNTVLFYGISILACFLSSSTPSLVTNKGKDFGLAVSTRLWTHTQCGDHIIASPPPHH